MTARVLALDGRRYVETPESVAKLLYCTELFKLLMNLYIRICILKEQSSKGARELNSPT